MGKHDGQDLPVSATQFMAQFMRLKRGSISRRHFLGVTGLGLATAALGGACGHPFVGPVAAQDAGRIIHLNSWPNYHDPATFEA
ncbi:MAG: twin-arginine translocation signal domain-containing protein, partial [Rhizobium sp.]|nr:twin-arginine translocation signal domain-containing protein [Rhizobium sp.]